MNAKELRIGNILKINTGEYAIVDSLSSDGVIGYNIKDTEYYVHYDPELEDKNELTPVKITPEILKKCGAIFKHNEVIFESNGRLMVIEGNHDGYYYTGGEGVTLSEKIKYLHQLQNIYLALTGEELEINL